MLLPIVIQRKFDSRPLFDAYRLREKTIKEVRIIPFDNGRHFKIQYVYEVASEEKGLNKDNAMETNLTAEDIAEIFHRTLTV